MNIETKSIHAGHPLDPATGAVIPPIHLSTTFERQPEGSYPAGYDYSRSRNPNRDALLHPQCSAYLCQGLFQIGDQILIILNTRGVTDQGLGDTHGCALFLADLDVTGRGRGADNRLHRPQIGCRVGVTQMG